MSATETTYTREELIALCEDAIRPESAWRDRDSESAHRQVGEAWALLRAGCEFTIECDDPATNDKTIWVRIVSAGFQYFEWGEDEFKRSEVFYIPTRERLNSAGEGDWY